MDLSHVLFSPNGRIGQQEYWIGILILIAANVVATFIPLLGILISFFLIYVGICIYGKRLHDAGKSAWVHGGVWLLQFILLIVGFTMAGGAIMAAMANGGGSDEANIAAVLGASGSLILVFGLGFVVWIVYTIWVGLSAGEAGDNRFGAVPGTVPVASAAPAATPSAPEPTVQSTNTDAAPES